MPELGNKEGKSISPRYKSNRKSEFWRRNVIRPSLVYILLSIVAWKSADVLNLPSDYTGMLPLILTIFLPLAMFLAWKFEFSPSGFIRTSSKASYENPYSDTQKKPLTSNVFIAILLAITVALFVFWPETNHRKFDDNGLKKEIID